MEKNNLPVNAEKKEGHKFCPHCGYSLNASSFKFCPDCGRPLDGGQMPEAYSPGIESRPGHNGEKKGPNPKMPPPTKYIPKNKLPSYIAEQLIYGENAVYVCKIHWKIWLPSIFWAIITGLVFYVVSIVFNEPDYLIFALPIPFIIFLVYFCKAIIEDICTCLAITNKRVICKFGFIRRKTFEMNIDKVESVQLDQSFWGRIFDCSTVSVNGTGQMSAPVPNIIDAKEFKQILLSEGEKAKTARN